MMNGEPLSIRATHASHATGESEALSTLRIWLETVFSGIILKGGP